MIRKELVAASAEEPTECATAAGDLSTARDLRPPVMILPTMIRSGARPSTSAWLGALLAIVGRR